MQQIGRYRVVREIARGGIGVVYEGQDPESNRSVAIKVLLAGKNASELQRQRFEREVQALIRLKHPSLVRIRDAGTWEGSPYLAMDLLEGATLAERLERDGPLDTREAAFLVGRLADGIQHAHEQGVLHRDLKPQNIIVPETGLPRLTDFGLTRDVDTSLVGTQLSVQGRFLGTPGYWPPEQASGEVDAVGPHSDIYGLGAVLYAVVTGQAPHVGESLVELFVSMEQGLVPPSLVLPGVDPGLEAVCMRCLQRDPQDRYASAAELAADLQRVYAGEEPRAERVSGPGNGSRAPRLLAAVAVLVGVGTAIAFGLPDDPQPVETPIAEETPSADPDPAPPDRKTSVVVSGPAAELYEQGRKHLEAGDTQRALDDLNQALELDRSHAEVYSLRGRIRFEMRNPRGALQDAERAINLDGDHAEALALRSLCRAHYNQLEDALADAERAVSLRANATTLVARGQAYMRNERNAEALADFERSLRLEPRQAYALRGRGMAHHKLGNRRAARESYEQALNIDPRDLLTLMNLGKLKMAYRDFRGAESEFTAALAVSPSHPARLDSLKLRCQARLALKEYVAAEDDITQAIRGGARNSRTLHTRAVIRFHRGRYPKALTDIDEALRGYDEGDPQRTRANELREQIRERIKTKTGAVPRDSR